MGAQYAFPGLPPVLGQLMFWAGVLGLVAYPAWHLRSRIKTGMDPPLVLVVVGL
jgi:hypothetical protein